MSFLDFFTNKLRSKSVTTWKELGTFNALFSNFGTDIYDSAMVRSCIRPLADFTSKASCKCSKEYVERLLNTRPNMYMDGPSFLMKCRNLYEIKNNCFIYVSRDNKNAINGFYPVPYTSFTAVEYQNGLFLQFKFANGSEITLPWVDLAPLRKDYVKSDIAGESNGAIIETLQVIATSNQGVSNAIKATANLRGILQSKQAMLSKEDIKAQKDAFVRDYMGLDNEGGIASLDASQTFTPISMSPIVANAAQMKEFRENVYRYFGVNDKVIMSAMNSDEIEAFYEMKIEPFLVQLSSALCSVVFTQKELGFKNYLMFEANKLQFVSLTKKISLYKEVVLNGGMTPNEWRLGCNMEPIEGGDALLLRLDVGKSNDTPNEPTEEEDEQNGDENTDN